MTKNGLIVMGVMVVVITVSGRIIGIMNQRSTPRYNELTRAESLLYDKDYKVWLICCKKFHDKTALKC